MEVDAASSSSSPLVAVGMWTDMSVRLLSLPTLQAAQRCELGGDTQVTNPPTTNIQ